MHLFTSLPVSTQTAEKPTSSVAIFLSFLCNPGGLLRSKRLFNKSIILFSLISLSILEGCGGGTGQASTPPPVSSLIGVPPPYAVRSGTWVVMGSSTAAGSGAPSGKGWVAVLQGTLSNRGIQFANIAKPSTSTYSALSSSSVATPNRPVPDPALNIDQALSRNPVALILSFPTNDTALGYSSDETISNLSAIRTMALKASVPVMVMSTQPRSLTDANRSMLKNMNARMAESFGACFINVYESLADQDGRLTSTYDSGDGIHPNEAGHKLIASIVQSKIESGECVNAAP